MTPTDKLAGRAEAIQVERDRRLAEARERRAAQQQSAVSVECQPGVGERPAIDFEAVKSAITIAAVLGLLGIVATKTQHRGPCPLHGSTSGTSRYFSVNLDDNVFQCFKCGCCWNALELWAKAMKQTPYDAAVDLCQQLGIELPLLTSNPRTEKRNP